MKKIWKMRKDAVSPVIATILMVAITVVLAAVLYVMVMGFSGPGQQTPTGAFTMAEKTDAKHIKYQFGEIQPETSFINCKIRVEGPGITTTTVDYATFAANKTVEAGVFLLATDLASDGKISVGDYMQVHTAGALASGTYKLTLIYTPTGGAICDKSLTV